jgi:hypothetical protein
VRRLRPGRIGRILSGATGNRQIDHRHRGAPGDYWPRRLESAGSVNLVRQASGRYLRSERQFLDLFSVGFLRAHQRGSVPSCLAIPALKGIPRPGSGVVHGDFDDIFHVFLLNLSLDLSIYARLCGGFACGRAGKC